MKNNITCFLAWQIKIWHNPLRSQLLSILGGWPAAGSRNQELKNFTKNRKSLVSWVTKWKPTHQMLANELWNSKKQTSLHNLEAPVIYYIISILFKIPHNFSSNLLPHNPNTKTGLQCALFLNCPQTYLLPSIFFIYTSFPLSMHDLTPIKILLHPMWTSSLSLFVMSSWALQLPGTLSTFTYLLFSYLLLYFEHTHNVWYIYKSLILQGNTGFPPWLDCFTGRNQSYMPNTVQKKEELKKISQPKISEWKEEPPSQ